MSRIIHQLPVVLLFLALTAGCSVSLAEEPDYSHLSGTEQAQAAWDAAQAAKLAADGVERWTVDDGLPDRDEYYARLKVDKKATHLQITEAFHHILINEHKAYSMRGLEETPEEGHIDYEEHKKKFEAKNAAVDPAESAKPTDASGSEQPVAPAELLLASRAQSVLLDEHLRAAYDEGGHEAVQKILRERHTHGPLTAELPDEQKDDL